jgi:hypothetical protein
VIAVTIAIWRSNGDFIFGNKSGFCQNGARGCWSKSWCGKKIPAQSRSSGTVAQALLSKYCLHDSKLTEEGSYRNYYFIPVAGVF